MRRTFALWVVGGIWVQSTAASAASAQPLRDCVQRALAELPQCIKLHGKQNADPCRTGILMVVSECADKFDPEKLHAKDPERWKILFDACVSLHNKGTGQTAQEECDLMFPRASK